MGRLTARIHQIIMLLVTSENLFVTGMLLTYENQPERLPWIQSQICVNAHALYSRVLACSSASLLRLTW